MNLVPGLSLRATEKEEEEGLDESQLGEFAYDYVELRREFGDNVKVIEGREGSRSGSVEEVKGMAGDKV